MTIPTISSLPTAPSRGSSPATFSLAMDALLSALPTLVSEFNTATAAIPNSVLGIDFTGTSTTSLTVGTGSKSITTQSSKNWFVGQPVRVSSTASPANYMDGQVTAYSGTSLTVNVTGTGGAGTIAAWTIGPVPGAGSYATIAGAETLTNKTFTTPILSATASGTTAGALGYSGGLLTYGNGSAQRTVVTTVGTQTITGDTTVQGIHKVLPAAGWSAGNTAQVQLGDSNNTIQATNGAAVDVYAFADINLRPGGGGIARITIKATGNTEFNGNAIPQTDNSFTTGNGTNRWATVYAVTGTINTSDETEKQWRGAATEAELRAARRMAGELGFYQWLDAIAAKGDEARYHFGARAQRVWAIMADEGLVDPIGDDGRPGKTPYAFLCFDEWGEEDGKPAGYRFGLRVEQLAMFILAAQEQRLAALEAVA